MSTARVGLNSVSYSRCVLAAALVAALGAGVPAEAARADDEVLILAQPFARTDAIWMAQAKGFFKEENLKVTVRWVSSGADALSTFQGGREGKPSFADFVIVNELLAVNVWQVPDGSFAVIAALARDAKGYVAITGPKHDRDAFMALRRGPTSRRFTNRRGV